MPEDVIDKLLERLDELGEGATEAIRLFGERIVAEAIVAVTVSAVLLVVSVVLFVVGTRLVRRGDNGSDDQYVGTFLLILGGMLSLVGIIAGSINLPHLMAPEGYAVREFLQLVIP